jgi:hypothetical protein
MLTFIHVNPSTMDLSRNALSFHDILGQDGRLRDLKWIWMLRPSLHDACDHNAETR